MINSFRSVFEARTDKSQIENIFHGECVDLIAKVVTDGVPDSLQYYTAHGIYQATDTTSADVWYPINTTISGDSVVLHWTPANELGSDSYKIFCLMEKPGETAYPLVWTLNLGYSPGYPAHPVDPIPEQLDFSKYELLNAPWIYATETDTSWIVNKVIQVPGLEVSAVSAQDIVIDQGSLYDKITGLDDKIDGVSGDLLGLSGDFSDCCSGINDKLDGMSETIDGRFETVNDNIAAFNEPISTIIDNTEGLDEQLYSIKSDTDGLQESIRSIQYTLDNPEYGLNAIKNAVDSINLDTSNLATSAQAQSIYAAVSGLEIPDDYAKEATLESVSAYAAAAYQYAASGYNYMVDQPYLAKINGRIRQVVPHRGFPAVLSDINAVSGMQIATNGLLNDETYGLEAIRNSIDGISFPNDYAKEATLDTVSADLNNQYYGLAAIRNGVDLAAGYSLDSKNLLNNSTYGLNALRSEILNAKSFAQSAYTTVTNQTYGNQAIKNAVDSINLDTSNLATKSDVAAVKAVVDENNAHLENSNYGLEAIDTVTTQINNRLVDATNGLAAIKTEAANANIALGNQNYGLNAISTKVTNLGTSVGLVKNAVDSVKSDTASIKTTVEAIVIPTDYAKQNTLLAASGTMVSGVEAIRNDIANIDIDIPSDYAKQLTLTSGVEAIRQDIANIDFDTSDLATSAQVSGVSADILSLSGDFSQCCTNLTTKMNVVSAGVADIQDSLGNPTYGLASIYGALDSIGSNVNNINQLAIGQHGFDALAYDISQLSNDLYNVYYSVYDSYQKEGVVYIAGINRGLLQNGTYGLEAIKNKLNTTDTHATSAANRSYDNYSLLTSATNGLADIKTKVNTTDTHATSAAQQAKSAATDAAYCKNLLDDQQYGLLMVANYAYDADTTVTNQTYGNQAIKTKLDTTDTHATSAANRSYDIYSIVNNGTYGNSAIKNRLDILYDGDYGLETLKGTIDDAFTAADESWVILNNDTYGNSAIKTKLNTTDSHATSAAQQAKNAYDILNNGTYGNSAIRNAINTTNARLDDQTIGLEAIKNAVTSITIPTDYAKQATLVSVSGDLNTDYLALSGQLGDLATALDVINGEVL